MKTYLLKAGVRQAIAKAGETDIAVAYNALEWANDYPSGRPQLMVTTPGGVRVPVTVAMEGNLIIGKAPDELLVNPGVYSYMFVWTSAGTQVLSGNCECIVLGTDLAKTWANHGKGPDWAERIFLAAEVIEGAMNGVMQARNDVAEAKEQAVLSADKASESKEAAEAAQEAAEAALVVAETYNYGIEVTDKTLVISPPAVEIVDVMVGSYETINGSGRVFFCPTTATKIRASESCVFTGRNVLPYYDALGQKYPTVDNNLAYRGLWGTENADATALLNQLPAGKYTLTVGFKLNEPNDTYNGTSGQSVKLMCVINGEEIESGDTDITNMVTGGIAEASISFTLTESTAGHIEHMYLYCGNVSGGVKLKWKYKIAYAQIESGGKTTYQAYRERTGKEITAFDSKMSAYAAGSYSITYRAAVDSEEEGSTNSDEEAIQLPDYFQEEVDDCVSKLENYCTDKALIYLIVTDTHVHKETNNATKNRWKTTVRNIKALHARYQADAMIHLGDMINGTLPSDDSKEIIRMIRDDMRGVMDQNFILVGNHDTNTIYGSNMEAAITETEMYALWGRYNEKNIAGRPGHVPYFYKDYDSLGIRVIYLSSSMGDGTHGTNGDNWGFPADEVTWLQNVALDTDYQVLMFSHMPLSQGYISNANNLPYNGPLMLGAVTAFQNRGGVVIGLVNGHTHFDYVHDNGHFTEVSVGCTKITDNAEDKYGTDIYAFAPSEAVCYGRTDNTVTQDLWNILVVKPTERECKIIRFGAGDDVTWTY